MNASAAQLTEYGPSPPSTFDALAWWQQAMAALPSSTPGPRVIGLPITAGTVNSESWSGYELCGLHVENGGNCLLGRLQLRAGHLPRNGIPLVPAGE
jgi:hypothetical protein